ncbi:gastrula zinc finger protein xFG20-1-like [Thunnus thynnus]|uniref:gastrula zinc finger protein xFG20-1-like n=1 Tax=Thunnus thynnus TaxID=8237 RepID=UPI003528C6D5
MSKVQMLRASVTQRLTAAAEEIFVLFERSIAEYEEELSRSKEKNERQRKLLDAVFNPQLQLHRADIQQLLKSKEEVPPEQQEWSSSLHQEDPEPPHIKEEQEELWSSQEGEQLQGLEEADITKFTFTSVPVKSEDDEKKLQFLQLHQRQTEENREAALEELEEVDITKFTVIPAPVKSEEDEEKPLLQLHQRQTEDNREAEPTASISIEQMETETDGEDCGGSEPVMNLHPGGHLQPDTDDKTLDSPETDVSDDWTETREPQSDLNSLKNKEILVSDMKFNTGNNSFICSQCGKKFASEESLQRHMTLSHHTGMNAFSCELCNKTFTHKIYLTIHMGVHTGEKRFSCRICEKRFTWRTELRRHKCVGKSSQLNGGGKKPVRNSVRVRELRCRDAKNSFSSFSCSKCKNNFDNFHSLERHLRTHKKEKPFSCPFCGKLFAHRAHLTPHIAMHTGERPYSCRLCYKRFTWPSQVKNHKCVRQKHTQLHQRQSEQMETEADGEDCGRSEPARNSHPDTHLQCDTDEKTSVFPEPDPGPEVREDDWKVTREPQSGLQNDVPVSSMSLTSSTKRFTCCQCGETFLKKNLLVRHMKHHTKKQFSCSLCGKEFVCKETLKAHKKWHEGQTEFSFSFCGKIFTHVRQLLLHSNSHKEINRFKCSVCDETFYSFSAIKRHKCNGESSKLHKPGTSQEGEQLQGLEEADTPKFTFTPLPVKSEDDEEKPQSSQFHQRQTEQMETEVDGEDCGGPVSDPDRHLQPDTDDKTREFGRSGDDRESQSDLNCQKSNRVPVSDRRAHKGEKQFSCSICGAKSASKSGLKQHMICHFRKKSFSCSNCDKRFSCYSELKRHKCDKHPELEVEINNDEVPKKPVKDKKPFSCPECGRRFASRAAQDNHMRIHLEGKKYSCQVCNAIFCQGNDLARHMKSHRADKPFRCTQCDKSFGYDSSLRLHMKCHSTERLSDCPMCTRKFKSNKDVLNHLKVHAGNQKPFICPFCKTVYLNKKSWIKHMKTYVGQKSADQFLAKESK